MLIGMGTGQNTRATWRGHPARRPPYARNNVPDAHLYP